MQRLRKKIIKEVILRIIIYIAIAMGLLLLYVKYLESQSIFFPTKDIELTPADVNLSYEDVNLETADNIKIHGWFIPYDHARYTVLFCHGNGGNISHRLEKILLLRPMGVNIFIIDYRGYGLSQGRPSEKGVYLDTKAAYDYLVNERNISPEHIIAYGESLGASVIVDLARHQRLGALILEGAFSNVKDMGKEFYPYLPKFIFPNLFDSLEKIKKVNVPKLFIHSRDDEIVPFKLGKKLYDAAPAPKWFAEIVGGHNNGFVDSQEKYVSAIAVFINSLKQQ